GAGSRRQPAGIFHQLRRSGAKRSKAERGRAEGHDGSAGRRELGGRSFFSVCQYRGCADYTYRHTCSFVNAIETDGQYYEDGTFRLPAGDSRRGRKSNRATAGGERARPFAIEGAVAG